MAEFFASIDTEIMGRKTLDAARRMGGSFTGSKIAAYVMSRTQPQGPRDGLTFVGRSPAELIADLRKQEGKDIWLMGGGELAREFLKDDLVDEIHLGIVPTLLGEGIPLFPSGFPERKFELLENKTYSKGLIALKYRRLRTKKKQK